MLLPEDVRAFRNLSLLHDTSLNPQQRARLAAEVSTTQLEQHEQFVQTLLGSGYVGSKPKNRAAVALFALIKAKGRYILGLILKTQKSNH